MKKVALALLLFTLSFLLYKDFFPEGETAVLGIAIIVFLTYCLSHYKLGKSTKHSKEKKQVISQLFLTIYLVLLIFVFTIFKGKSSVGISFDNIFFWLVLMITIIELITRWRKVSTSVHARKTA
ncbi:hypothetical protein MHZ92_05880 [Sporosarcina sp. ACRSL]|uniref:hypothetical protein n=1 Tax=Sporosarcina sp. ACRSL TaxID=2918215 RepID=UPI001EF65B10|nr:hypothetical protein [Sporosarcina sp. ACRSL]MCG7343652.1 hypothetical protein [Sporosarcina sp. ACRSL]